MVCAWLCSCPFRRDSLRGCGLALAVKPTTYADIVAGAAQAPGLAPQAGVAKPHRLPPRHRGRRRDAPLCKSAAPLRLLRLLLLLLLPPNTHTQHYHTHTYTHPRVLLRQKQFVLLLMGPSHKGLRQQKRDRLLTFVVKHGRYTSR